MDMTRQKLQKLAEASNAMRNCEHTLSEIPVKDPNDKRRTLRPDIVMGVHAYPCTKCGCFVFEKNPRLK